MLAQTADALYDYTRRIYVNSIIHSIPYPRGWYRPKYSAASTDDVCNYLWYSYSLILHREAQLPDPLALNGIT